MDRSAEVVRQDHIQEAMRVSVLYNQINRRQEKKIHVKSNGGFSQISSDSGTRINKLYVIVGHSSKDLYK